MEFSVTVEAQHGVRRREAGEVLHCQIDKLVS